MRRLLAALFCSSTLAFAQTTPMTPLKIAVIHKATAPSVTPGACVNGTSPDVLADDTGKVYTCINSGASDYYEAVPGLGVTGGDGIVVTGASIATASGESGFISSNSVVNCATSGDGAIAMNYGSGALQTCADGSTSYLVAGNSVGGAYGLAMSGSPYLVSVESDTTVNIGDFLKITSSTPIPVATWVPFASGVQAAELDAAHDTAAEVGAIPVGGNAGTATELAADPANCTAGSAAGGVVAAGTAEACIVVPVASDTAYDAGTWDANTDVPSKNAVRDKIETMLSSKCDAWPVGAVFIGVTSTSPATLLGCGTWSSIAAGRVLVGLDSGDTDFDTVEETGGAKTTTIGASNLPQLAVAITDPGHAHTQTTSATDGATTRADSSSGGTSYSNVANINSNTTGITATANTGGANTAISRMNPYFVVYMWKRTA
jgi:hypothetical protein